MRVRPLTRDRRFLREHRLFVLAVVLAATVRLVVMLGFTPAFVLGDGPAYLSFLETFVPQPTRPAGYGLLVLYPLSQVTSGLVAVALVQHLMGLGTAVMSYALLRRWGVTAWLATLATLPVLYDGMQLMLEHSVLSDTLFEFLVVAAVVVVGWRRQPPVELALAGGLLLGTAVTVRLVGEPLVLGGVAFCLAVGHGWRQKLRSVVALVLGFAVPVGAYMTWYHHDHGVYALSQYGGESLYMRTTSFVDCSRVSVPRYERVLCPAAPVGHRRAPDWYTWHDPRTVPRLRPPPGTTADQAMRQFALAAIRAQPVAYARVVLRDFMLNFDVWRGDRFEYHSAVKWRFSRYLHPLPSQVEHSAYRDHGGAQLVPHAPFASAMARYGRFVYLPGPLLLACLVLGLIGGLGGSRAKRSGMRPLCLLLTGTGLGLILLPDLVGEFVWRYQLPALALLPAGAALAATALRGEHRADER
ncbi:MAG: hypothetical protein QOK30_1308 [Nocardioidaceae bacterium]|jgi:hypothetical protein|nr:hypothetical protein [Nocardioidaceae bacterium]